MWCRFLKRRWVIDVGCRAPSSCPLVLFTESNTKLNSNGALLLRHTGWLNEPPLCFHTLLVRVWASVLHYTVALLDKNTAQHKSYPTKSDPQKTAFESRSTVGIHTSLHDSARWFQRGDSIESLSMDIQFFNRLSLLSRVKEENLILYHPNRRDFVDESRAIQDTVTRIYR